MPMILKKNLILTLKAFVDGLNSDEKVARDFFT